MIEKIKSYLNSYFGHETWKQLDNEVPLFRVQNFYADKPYQNIYIDLTCKCNELEFDLEKHIEQYLLNDYYSETGYLQWNYYYYFIVGDKEVPNPGLKYSIENNTTYARKFVMNLKEFENSLKLNSNIGKISNIDLEDDLSTIWISYLRDKKLYPVYNKDQYFMTDAVTAILNDEDLLDETNNESNSVVSEGIIENIGSFKFIISRKYPLQKEYHFKKANLITGTNASGKTSLLSGIEILLTGDNSKSNSFPQFHIEATYQSGVLTYPSNDNQIYKQRDKTWYNSGRAKGEKLNANFNRYNYYCCDSAFELEYTGKNGERELLKALQTIALGNEVNELEARILKLKSEFENSMITLQKEKSNKEITLNKTKTDLEFLRKDLQNPDEYLNILANSLNEIGYISASSIQLTDLKSIIPVETNILRGKEICENITRTHPAINSYANLKNELETFQVIATKISQIEDEERKTVNNLESQKALLDDTQNLIESYSRYLAYLNLPNHEIIIGLEYKLDQEHNQLKYLQEVVRLSRDIFWNRIQLRKDINIDILKKQRIDEQQALLENISNQANIIEEVESNIKKIDKILSDIKVSATEYLQLQPETENCPVCSAHYPSGELLRRLNDLDFRPSNFAALEKMRINVNDLKKQLEANKEEIEILEKMLALKAFLILGNYQVSTIEDLRTTLESNNQKLTQSQVRINEFESYKDLLRSQEMSEQEYTNLKASFEDAIDPNDISYFEQLVATQKGNVQVFESRIESYLNDLRNLRDTKRRILTDNGSEPEIIEKIGILKKMDELFRELKILLLFTEETSISSIIAKLDRGLSLTVSCKSFLEDYTSNTLAEKTYSETIKELDLNIEKLEKQLGRATFAFEQLTFLCDHHGKNKYLQDYIEKNKEEILDIFMLIHSPKEFSGLDITEDSIQLIRKESNERAGLLEISTGQRTALALSIFLSLNKKLRHGPKILIFDDPIAFVDDLNILSFLDYLRQLVIQAGKQIFFATASPDLAFLFKKKFEFLNDEFYPVPLLREPA